MQISYLYIDESKIIQEKVAKGASYVKLPIKNQPIVKIKDKYSSCGIYSIFVFFYIIHKIIQVE